MNVLRLGVAVQATVACLGAGPGVLVIFLAVEAVAVLVGAGALALVVAVLGPSVVLQQLWIDW